jgi:hypothetical protein
VTLVVMEAASAYWKPPFYLLEDDIECWVVNARGEEELLSATSVCRDVRIYPGEALEVRSRSLSGS